VRFETQPRYRGHRRHHIGVINSHAGPHAGDSATLTPIKHVIITFGENRTFDHIFATYEPVHKREKVFNLLSEGIVNADGSPGPNYGDALQYRAFDTKQYNLTPPKTPYVVLPPALVGGTSTPYVCKILGITTGTSCDSPANETAAKTIENGLANGYDQFLLTGGTGQTNKTPDQRIFYDGQGPSHLPPGPFQRRKHSPTTPTRRARCTATIRCISSSIAMPPRRPSKTAGVAAPIYFPG